MNSDGDAGAARAKPLGGSNSMLPCLPMLIDREGHLKSSIDSNGDSIIGSRNLAIVDCSYLQCWQGTHVLKGLCR